MPSPYQVSEVRRRTILPTFAFIFGMTDFGLMIFRWTTLQNALREATRYAVTFQTQSGYGQDASIMRIVQQNALGFVTIADTPQHIFVNYYSPADLVNAIGSGGNVPGNLVEVQVRNNTTPPSPKEPTSLPPPRPIWL
jgi:Flp pilus assembly protein TadG